MESIFDEHKAWTESSLNFASNNKNAKFVKIDIKNLDHESFGTKAQQVRDYLLSKWSLEYPKLIISVTGGAQNFKIPKRLEKAFKRGLYKTASNAKAWIVTSGTNCGVMRLVGEALADEIDGDIVCLGISSWSMLEKKDDIQNHLKKNKAERYKYVNVNDIDRGSDYVDDISNRLNPSKLLKAHLDHNHTHFLLLHSGSNNVQEEIDFSLELEIQLRTKTNDDIIPTILIVVNGGINTLKTVICALEYQIPILVLAESKGCADMICEIVSELKSRDTLNQDELVNKLLDKYKKNLRFQNQQQRMERKAIVMQFLNVYKDKMDKQLLNIFRLNDNENDYDIDFDILETLIKVSTENGERNYFKTFELALSWNCIDIAKRKILDGDENISITDRHELLEKALIENKYEFVELLLEYGVNLKMFLTKQRLNNLYKSIASNKLAEPFKRLLKLMFLWNNKRNCEMNYIKSLKYILANLTYVSFSTKIIPDEDVSSVHIQKNYTTENLFIWAILTNRIEIAKIFWKRTDSLIANALIASKVLRSMSKRLPDFKDALKQPSEEFEDLAIKLLQECLKRTHDEINAVILLTTVPSYDECILDLAHKCKCLHFIALEQVQNMIHRIWSFKGDYTYKSSRFLHDYCNFFFEKENYIDKNELYPFEQALVDEAKHDKDNYLLSKELERINDHVTPTDTNKTRDFFNKLKKGHNKAKEFWNVPSGVYLLYMVSYLAFLFLLSRKVLFVNREYLFFEDMLLHSCIASFFVIELFQFFWFDLYKNTCTFPKKALYIFQNDYAISRFKIFIARYFHGFGNWLDLCGIFLYVLANMNCVKHYMDDDTYRMLLIADFIIWSIRFLQYCSIYKKIGQTYAMIREIIKKDLIFFVVVSAVVCISYGVAITSLCIDGKKRNDLNSKNQNESELNTTELIKAVVDTSYWPFFGQIINIGCMLTDCNNTVYDKQTLKQKNVRYILLMMYVIVVLVLINVLIALFNKTFQQVDAQSEIIWKYQRYRFVMSYAGSLKIFPPFTLLYLVYFSIRLLWIFIITKCCKKSTYDYINETENCHKEKNVDYSNIQSFEKKCAEYCLRELNKEKLSKQILDKLSDNMLNIQQALYEMYKQNANKEQQLKTSKLSRQGDRSAVFSKIC